MHFFCLFTYHAPASDPCYRPIQTIPAYRRRFACKLTGTFFSCLPHLSHTPSLFILLFVVPRFLLYFSLVCLFLYVFFLSLPMSCPVPRRHRQALVCRLSQDKGTKIWHILKMGGEDQALFFFYVLLARPFWAHKNSFIYPLSTTVFQYNVNKSTHLHSFEFTPFCIQQQQDLVFILSASFPCLFSLCLCSFFEFALSVSLSPSPTPAALTYTDME